MTEVEARKKWCPFVRVSSLVNTADGGATAVAVNRGPGFEQHQLSCVGSSCMAWRWGETERYVEGLAVQHGYCGLAGEPLR